MSKNGGTDELVRQLWLPLPTLTRPLTSNYERGCY
eukprot:CAMPEP_0204135978 /NCGR_PEP_ID=MMETSP0361-20130328/16571_1 /ASSEMBLY_ACC=CAM_ASM_000343 /TAXON_ID=268821 /ORGANISM="Scrippsiella Hangoei, Strain SHTV-5" /LENGTH=34 /DNA_ID= /DNA_START= /DNA_END= /DNA_ORIENTATION=